MLGYHQHMFGGEQGILQHIKVVIHYPGWIDLRI
jgi:hypothetical protein